MAGASPVGLLDSLLAMNRPEKKAFWDIDNWSTSNRYKLSDKEATVMKQCRNYSYSAEGLGALSGILVAAPFLRPLQHIARSPVKMIGGFAACIVGGQVARMYGQVMCMRSLLEIEDSELGLRARQALVHSPYAAVAMYRYGPLMRRGLRNKGEEWEVDRGDISS